ncbi:MAG: hypothetical protein AAF434_18955 [Pseudomonadota bacterium]
MFRRIFTTLLFFVFVTPLWGGNTGGIGACETQECLIHAMRQHPVRKIDRWDNNLNSPIYDRIQNAPADIINYIEIDNRANGFPSGVRAAENGIGIKDVQSALRDIPETVLNHFEKSLVGIFLVENLGSSGYVESIADHEGRFIAGFIVLDASVLARTANEWATWRDNTAFVQDATCCEIRTTIAERHKDNSLGAIQFILLHELGHVLSITRNTHPHWWGETDGLTVGDFPFADISWRVSKNKKNFISRFDRQFPLARELVFYQKPQLHINQARSVLQQLGETNFPSLYSTTRVEEDFAETFAIFVHTEIMRKPYQIEFFENELSVKKIDACFTTHCLKKADFLRALLN